MFEKVKLLLFNHSEIDFPKKLSKLKFLHLESVQECSKRKWSDAHFKVNCSESGGSNYKIKNELSFQIIIIIIELL